MQFPSAYSLNIINMGGRKLIFKYEDQPTVSLTITHYFSTNTNSNSYLNLKTNHFNEKTNSKTRKIYELSLSHKTVPLIILSQMNDG